LIAGVTLLIFAFLGTVIFKLYAITIEALQIMGGILFFRTGLNMLEAKLSRTRTTPVEREESMDRDYRSGSDHSCNAPVSKAPSKLSYGILLLSILLVLIVVYFSFIYGEKTAKKIGQTNIRIIQRIMGLILMVIAVQFVINGTESVLSRIF
jgi:multiple antibiotic resistance protein